MAQPRPATLPPCCWRYASCPMRQPLLSSITFPPAAASVIRVAFPFLASAYRPALAARLVTLRQLPPPPTSRVHERPDRRNRPVIQLHSFTTEHLVRRDSARRLQRPTGTRQLRRRLAYRIALCTSRLRHRGRDGWARLRYEPGQLPHPGSVKHQPRSYKSLSTPPQTKIKAAYPNAVKNRGQAIWTTACSKY